MCWIYTLDQRYLLEPAWACLAAATRPPAPMFSFRPRLAVPRRGDSVHNDPNIEAIFTDLITRVLCAAGKHRTWFPWHRPLLEPLPFSAASDASQATGTHYSRNIAGALWSAAKVKYRGLGTLQYVLERAFTVHKDEFNSQALSNSMWAFATLRMHPPPTVVKVVCDGLVREMDKVRVACHHRLGLAAAPSDGPSLLPAGK